MKKKSLVEFGLTRENLFDVNLAMPYWLQLGHQEFLMSVIHDLREQAISSNYFLKDIGEDEKVSRQPLASHANKKTVKEVCEIIEERNNRALDILNVMWEYAVQAMQEDEPQDE